LKIIQIRGNNGTGKTTIIREFIKGKSSDIIKVFVEKHEIECHKINDIIIIGRYDKNDCGGCDPVIKSGDELKNLIAKILKLFKPKILIFEGVMYGKSFDFTYQIYRYALKMNIDFFAICLEPDFDTSLERIYKRNGGKEINVKNLESGFKGCIRSNLRLEAMKVPLKKYNTGKMTPKEMGEILEEAIQGV
jgi:tRNA uridine 5-carbamoylmethylation protein Kti12